MIRYMKPFSKFSNSKFLPLVLLGILAVFISSYAQAQLFAPDPCDPAYYNSLEDRAWLEAQREITQNQNLIFKSDSVLEYTCFDQFAGILANWGGGPEASDKLFTANDRWGSPARDLAASLSDTVGVALGRYDTSNFNHDLLGGRMKGSSYNFNPNLTPRANYECNVMERVWTYAKCMDFIVDPAEDGFYTFQKYAADPDKRHLPIRCDKIADFATPYAEALIDTETPWFEDNLVTYFDLMYPPGGGCGGGLISTGLTVYRTSGNPLSFPEKVCIVPGCHYDPNAGCVK